MELSYWKFRGGLSKGRIAVREASVLQRSRPDETETLGPPERAASPEVKHERPMSNKLAGIYIERD
jgi:hypothetical protein